MRYRYYYGPNKVVAISSYGGKTVRGVAKCAPNDTFNPDTGAELARARCDVKVAEKRYKRSLQKFDEAADLFEAAQDYYDRMTNYADDAEFEYNEALVKLESLLSAL